MSGTDFVFNVAKGRIGYYADTAANGGTLILVPLEATGLVSDATLKDYPDLNTLLAGTTNEQTTMGRKTLSSVSVTIDYTNDKVVITSASPSYTTPTGNAIAKFAVCWKPSGGTDSTTIPLFAYSFDFTPGGVTISVVVNSNGLADAA